MKMKGKYRDRLDSFRRLSVLKKKDNYVPQDETCFGIGGSKLV